MTMFSSPELVAARIAERTEEAAASRLARAFRLARECCAAAASPLSRLFRRRPATTC